MLILVIVHEKLINPETVVVNVAVKPPTNQESIAVVVSKYV